MNLLYVHRTRAAGVEGVHIGQIVRCMRLLGHRVDMLSPVGDFIEHISPVRTEAPATGKRLHGLGSKLPELLFELLELAYSAKASVEATRRYRQGAVDAVYERYAIFGFAGLWLSQRRGVPHVLEVNYTSLTPLVRPRSRVLKPLAKWLDGFMFRRATHLMAVSSYLKQHLVEEFGIDASRISVVPNAADPAVFDPARVAALAAGALPEGPIIGFVGGFYHWHGLGLLLQAFKAIAERFPQAHLVLIGDGPMRADLVRQVQELGLGDRVLMPGKIAHADLVPYVARFDIGVMPDSNLYGSPMKIFEYMAMAVPVVVPDYAPLTDVVVDGVHGKVFERRDVAAMAECLAELLRDGAVRRRMGHNARQAIIDTHNWMNSATLAVRHLSTNEAAT